MFVLCFILHSSTVKEEENTQSINLFKGHCFSNAFFDLTLPYQNSVFWTLALCKN